jgi:lysophospholipase L1-like esterase
MPSDATGWPPWQDFNRDGVRDRAHALEKPEAVHRVICLGDSVTFGPDAHAEDAYPQRLQAELDARGPYAEVFNLSLWGWSTYRERLAYEQIGRRYRPDQVLLGICLNDVADLSALRRPPAWLVALHRRSALVRWAIDAEGRHVRGIAELFETPDSPRVRAGFERLFDEIRQLEQAVEADGAELGVLVFPFRPQLGSRPPEPAAQQRIAAFCVERGLPFLDLLPALRELGESALEPDDGIHLSPAGCARVAQEILARMIPAERTVARAVCRSLGVEDPRSIGVEQIPALIELLAAEDVRAAREAAWALGRLGPSAASAVPQLGAALGNAEAPLRRAAAQALGAIGAAARVTLPALFEALADERQAVRWSAAQAIWRIGPREPTIVPELAAVSESADLYVRAFALWYLGEMGTAGSGGVPVLARALRDTDPGLRGLAARALGKAGAGSPDAVVALRRSLASADWDDRWKAARALGRIGPSATDAVPDLEELLDDDSERVREEAARALMRIQG